MIALFGLAGSGKGTQGKALSELYGWRTFSIGELIRQSGKYNDTINEGRLISDDDVNAMMTSAIKKAEAEGFDVILDGYPRNDYQANYIMEHFRGKITGGIIIEVPRDELLKRLALRGRADDKERSSIERRFAVFDENMQKITDVFAAHNIPVEHVDGFGPVEAVTERLRPVFERLAPDATMQVNDVNGGEIEKSHGE